MRTLGSGNDLTTGVVWKKLMGFFFPVLFGLLFQQFYNTADAVIVGTFIGDEALAAVGGSATALTNLVVGFFTGLNSGASVMISQRFGAGDDEGLNKVLHTAVVFCCAMGLLLSVCGYVFTPAVLRLMGTPEDILDDSALYLRIYLCGAIPLLMYNLFQGTLQGVGDSKRPLRYLIISCILNIVLDTLFVAWLKMGVAGVGIASVISMVVCMLMALVHLMRVDGPHRIRIRDLRVDWLSLKRILKIGLPSGLQSSLYGISNVIIQSAVNSFGTLAVAAWTASSKLDGFYWSTSNSFGITICAFAGQCYGAGKTDRMKQATRTCMKIALVVTILLSTLLLLIALPAYGIFVSDPGVIDSAVEMMIYIVPTYFVWTFIEVLSGTFRGVGDTFRPMIITMTGTCGIRVLWMLLVVPVWHTIMAVCLVYGISWVITAIAFILYYRSGKWLR